MDLWIRTQNKTRLLKVDNLGLVLNSKFVEEKNNKWEAGWWICQKDDNPSLYLGVYQTRNRAMEVLDEIQKLLMGDLIIFKNIGTPEEVSKVLEDIKMKGFCWYTKNYMADEPGDNDKPATEFLHRDCVVYQMPEE